MNMKPLFGTALIAMLVLAGCDTGLADKPTVVQRNWLSIPALPVIQDAIFELSPTFNGQRNAPVMEQLCGLARGEVKQEQVNAFLKQQGVEAAKLPKQGNPLSLLVNGDQAEQTTACAAYLATTVLSTVDVTEFMHPVTTPPANGQPAKSSLQVDNALLNQALPIKLAEARANADVFALIAAELQRSPGLSVQQYHERISQLFARLAPTYLQRIKDQLPPAGTQFKLVQMDDSRFMFTSSIGSVFEYDSNGLILRQNGITWYGEGKLLGQSYPLQVAYFPASVNALLTPSKE